MWISNKIKCYLHSHVPSISRQIMYPRLTNKRIPVGRLDDLPDGPRIAPFCQVHLLCKKKYKLLIFLPSEDRLTCIYASQCAAIATVGI